MVLRFFLLASVFFFLSCTDVERDDPDDSKGKNHKSSSSSYFVQSSSSALVRLSSSVLSILPSSSSSITYTLACAAVPSTGIASTTITPPAVTCNGTIVSSGLSWTGAPNWSNPVAGTHSSISVYASYGDCSGKTAACSGTLTVSPAPSADELTCTGMPKTGVFGTAITQPTVRCGSSTVSTSIVWTNAPTWANPAAGTYNVSVAATCGGSSKTASCGTLTIASVLACASVPTSGTAGIAITAPAVTCNGIAISGDLTWIGTPIWTNPAAGTYSAISVSANSGNCSGKRTTCSGTLTVNAVPSSSSMPSSSSIVLPSSSSVVFSSSSATVWGEWVQTTAPTCTAAGVETRTNDLSQTQTRSVAQLAWSAWSVTTPATCEAAGSQTRTCPGNASPAQTQTIAQLAWSNWSVTTPATCAAAGVETRTCPGNALPAETRQVAQLTWDPATQFCQAGTNAVKDRCGGTATYTSTQFCQVGTNVVKSLCGTSTYTATQFCDSRDNKVYKWVTIGTQTWMAENLNYNANGSKCYNNQDSYCTQYGRLYDWATAMGISSSYNNSLYNPSSSTKYRGVCPSGWHISSNAEWTTLVNFVGAATVTAASEGTELKAKSGSGWNGQDTYGFSALPGGYGTSGDFFYGVDSDANWWITSELTADVAFVMNIDGLLKTNVVRRTGNKSSSLFSVRCLQD